MVNLYAALRFAEDKNIADRTYWYISGFPVRVGEQVLAPVGPHDRLQRAVVERIVQADEKNAPYDARFLKRVAAKAGARRLRAGGETFRELGGVRYDDRHYTRYGCVLVGRSASEAARAELAAYGVSAYYRADEEDETELFRALSCERGCALIEGRTADMAGAFLLLLAGVPLERARAELSETSAASLSDRLRGGSAEDALKAAGLTCGEIFRLQEKLR